MDLMLRGRVGDVAIREGMRGRAADAREAVFVRYLDDSLDRAYALAAVILGDRQDAEEVTHDAVCQAWAGLRDLRDLDKVEAWFTRILVNACRDRLRRRKVRPIRVALVDDGGATTADDPFDRLAADDALSHALAQLSPEHRAVLVLRYWGDLPVDEIAARTGQRAGTVKSRLHYALANLRAAWDRDDDRRTGR
jgi:RNA polymerase sigma-70 factor (ECF subfamily)